MSEESGTEAQAAVTPQVPALVEADAGTGPTPASQNWWMIGGVAVALLVGLYLLHMWWVKKSRASASCDALRRTRERRGPPAFAAAAATPPPAQAPLDNVKHQMNLISRS